MEYSSCSDVKVESPVKLIKMKPSLSENFDESAFCQIETFKKNMVTVTDKFTARIKMDSV